MEVEVSELSHGELVEIVNDYTCKLQEQNRTIKMLQAGYTLETTFKEEFVKGAKLIIDQHRPRTIWAKVKWLFRNR